MALTLCACHVETKTEPVPEAEGSGKKAINIRVEPMSRDEIKSAADKAIDQSAEAATKLRNAATTAVENMQKAGQAVESLKNTFESFQNQGESTAPANN